eukprot:s2010_g8.t1
MSQSWSEKSQKLPDWDFNAFQTPLKSVLRPLPEEDFWTPAMLAAPLKGMDAEALAGDAELREAMPDDVSTPPMGTDAGEDSNKDEQTGSTGGSDSDSPMMASTALPSIGSALHASGKCSRCCFYLKASFWYLLQEHSKLKTVVTQQSTQATSFF